MTSSAHAPWLLYGCTGYTGERLARHCTRVGLTPILAGRNEAKVSALANELGLAYRIGDLHNAEQTQQMLDGCHLVFNAAGPFTSTCLPILEACLKQKVHCLSLVGEIPMLETLQRYDQAAKDANICIGVGLGFDVMPTDCLASVLKHALPDATHLSIAMKGSNAMTAGSTKEFIEQIGEQPFWVRREGKLVEGAINTQSFDFGDGRELAVSIAWGDISSAYYSTGIRNIDVYTASSRGDVFAIKALSALKPLIRINAVQSLLNRIIDATVSGPSQQELENVQSTIIGEVTNAAGKTIRGKVTTASAYKMTVLGATYAIEQVLTNAPPSGYQTPAMLLGERSIECVDGSSIEIECA